MKKQLTDAEKTAYALALLDCLQGSGKFFVDADINLSKTTKAPTLLTLSWEGETEEPRYKAWQFYTLLYNCLYGCDPELEENEEGYKPL